jgi:catechol 2,3-dioxygenase-like lactoylglutathione lyase family enzyme
MQTVMDLQIRSLDHIVLNVGDVERSLRFYTQVLGLEPVRTGEFRAGKVRFPSVRIDATTIVDLFPPAMHKDAHGGANLNHFCLVTDGDVDKLAEQLRAAGIEITDRMENNFGARGLATSIYFNDPDGNVIEVRKY